MATRDPEKRKVYMAEYYSRPEVIASREHYHQLPYVLERKRHYQAAYYVINRDRIIDRMREYARTKRAAAKAARSAPV